MFWILERLKQQMEMGDSIHISNCLNIDEQIVSIFLIFETVQAIVISVDELSAKIYLEVIVLKQFVMFRLYLQLIILKKLEKMEI